MPRRSGYLAREGAWRTRRGDVRQWQCTCVLRRSLPAHSSEPPVPLHDDPAVSRTGDLLSCDIDGQTVLMSVEHGMYYGLDLVGSRIWALIETPRRVSEVCDTLVSEFDVSRPACESAVRSYLADLAAHRLVVIDHPES